MRKPNQIETAEKSHTNLNIFAAVVAILESGCVYHLGTSYTTAQRIIKLCLKEQNRQLRIHDKAVKHLASEAK